jgi:hypothetical protein
MAFTSSGFHEHHRSGDQSQFDVEVPSRVTRYQLAE